MKADLQGQLAENVPLKVSVQNGEKLLLGTKKTYNAKKHQKKSTFRKKSIQENSRNFLNIATPEEKRRGF